MILTIITTGIFILCGGYSAFQLGCGVLGSLIFGLISALPPFGLVMSMTNLYTVKRPYNNTLFIAGILLMLVNIIAFGNGY